MLTMDALRAFGANTDEGVARCFGKEDFYLRLVKMVVTQNQKDFDQLAAAIGAGDLAAAFDAAHSLKGVLGNLSLTPIFAPVSEITEQLRAKTEMDYAPALGVILAKFDELKALCAE